MEMLAKTSGGRWGTPLSASWTKQAYLGQHHCSPLLIVGVDLRRFRGLFKTENSARKGEHCHEQTLPTHRNFAEKLSGWLELPMRSILSPGSPVRSVSPMAPCEAGSTRMR